MHRKFIIYIAASLDGYIAAPDDDLSFLSAVEVEGEDYGYKAFVETVDTVILGRKTYDWVLQHAPAFSHAGKQTFVLTKTERPAVGNTVFYTCDPGDLAKTLQASAGKNIFIDGGAEIVHLFLQLQLVDELIVSFIPVLLGAGTRLFKDGRPGQQMQLVSSQAFPSGLVQLHYKLLRSQA